MRAVSFRKCRNLPKDCIHSGSAERAVLPRGASFSCKASLTNSLSVWLRSAALDLALRKRLSGMSIVVFTGPYYHIYGHTPFRLPSALLSSPDLPMRALRLSSFGQPLRMEEVPSPTPGPDDVVVEVRAAGVCHSDAHYRGGRGTVRRLPVTLGHEIAGVVVDRGERVSGAVVGERVAVHYLVACGTCAGCARGEQFCLCGEMVGKDRDGGQAERVLMPARNAVRVPQGISDEQAAIMMCSTATAYHALRKGRLERDETLLVLGFGGLGVSVARLGTLLGARRILAVDRVAAKLKAARAAGAIPVDANGNVAEQIDAATDGAGADIAIDLAGHPPLATAALRALAPGGRLVLVALNPKAFEFDPYSDVLAKERQIVGCSDHTRDEIVQLLDWAAAGRLDLTDAISRRIPLEAGAVNAALDELEQGTDHFRTVISVA
jgi:2-desacetyl-2-hydroxyethyl bacteriochlorophyllide A dehydrogenase